MGTFINQRATPSPAAVIVAFIFSLIFGGTVKSAEPIQISSDTFTNSDSQHATQVEPDTFSFGATVVAAFQSGRYFDGGASGIAFATSRNNGASWTSGVLPEVTIHNNPPGPYDRVSDPSVAYDAAHNVWLVASLGLNETALDVKGTAVLVNRSTDGGLTWSPPVVVSATRRQSDYDKTWIACDNWSSSPHFGNCYVSWDDFGINSRFLMSTSSDGGQTWGKKQYPMGQPTGLGGIPLPRPDGTVIVPASDPFGNSLRAFRSRNGGRTWSRARRIANVVEQGVAGNLRASNFLPSADVDASGKAYVVWSDCRFRAGCASNDLVMSTSTDGVHWSPVVRIPIDSTASTVDHFLPGFAVDHTTSGGTARLYLSYYYYADADCTETTCQLFVGFVYSPDGGTTWSTAQTLGGPMPPSWLAATSQGRMVGDYLSISLVGGGQAVAVFALADHPAGGVFDEAMFAGIVTPGGAVAVAGR